MKLKHLYYINLDYRTDRRSEMEEWLSESGWPSSQTERISAKLVPGRGHLGCTLSHIQTIQKFLESGENICMILEDDFQPFSVESFWSDIEKVLNRQIPFDILMLAHNNLESTPTAYEGILQLSRCYTSSGYLLTRHFAERLLVNLGEGFNKAIEYEETYKQKANDFCLDVYWSELMPSSNWFAIMPALGRQRASFSDIDGVYANRHA
jgi:glycosyl transferase family 25